MSSYDDMKEGDEVALRGRYGRLEKRVVTRTTKTRIILDSGDSFTRRGQLVGEKNEWFTTSIERWEEHHEAKLQEQKERDAVKSMVYKIRETKLDSLPKEKLAQICQIIDNNQSS